MKEIIINNKKYLKFKIGDEFEVFSSRKLFSDKKLKSLYQGDLTFKALEEKGLVSKEYDKNGGGEFIHL